MQGFHQQEAPHETANMSTQANISGSLSNQQIYTLTYIYLAVLPLSLLGSGSVIAVSWLKGICCQRQVRPLFILSISDFLAATFLISTAIIQLLPRMLYVSSYSFCVYGVKLALMFYAISFLMVIVYAFEVYQVVRSLRNARAPTQQEEDSCHDESSWRYKCYGLAWLIPVILFIVQLINRTSSMTDIVPVNLGDFQSPTTNRSGDSYGLFCSSCIILIHNSKDFCYQYIEHEYVNLGEKATFFVYISLVLICCMVLYCGSYISCETNERTPLLSGTRGNRGSYRAIQLFGIVFFCCWSPAFFLSVLSFTTVKPSSLYFLFFIQALTVSLHGLLNSLAYGWSRQNFRQEVIGRWQRTDFSKRFFEESLVVAEEQDGRHLLQE